MIEITIKRAAIARGVKTPAELARLMGVQDTVAGRLWRAEYNATLKSIDLVCNALGCKVSDVLCHVPDKDTPKASRPRRSTKKKQVKRVGLKN